MNPYVNEEMMWQRLKDDQREAENRRLVGGHPSLLEVARALGRRLWSRARPAKSRAYPAIEARDEPAASEVA